MKFIGWSKAGSLPFLVPKPRYSSPLVTPSNAGIYSALIGPDDVVFSDALNHASIIDGLRLTKAQKDIFPHQDFDHLEKLLQTVDAGQQAFVITESLFFNGW